MTNKIALGTVQFGLTYGINNHRGKVSAEEVSEIIRLARRSGVDTIDTANAYGDSERVLGRNDLSGFRVITKVPPGTRTPVAVKSSVESSRLRLGTPISAVFVHDYADYKAEPDLLKVLKATCKEFSIPSVGITCYTLDEVELMLGRGDLPDIVQLPFSIFDQRFASVASDLANQGVEVHTRSAFLQGLVFKDPDELALQFSDLFPLLKKLREYGDRSELIATNCLAFCLRQPFIHRVVIGVDSVKQFAANLEGVSGATPLLLPARDFAITDDRILNPKKWNT